jgi:hypothetical protein
MERNIFRPEKRPAEDQVGGALADHHDWSVQIARGDRGHDRAVGNPQAIDAAHARLWIDDGHLISIATHFACPT